MERYVNAGKSYEVESTECMGAVVNVNGTSITDCSLMAELTGMPHSSCGYTVFVDSDEVWFKTFEEAYDFAMNKQKGTFRI